MTDGNPPTQGSERPGQAEAPPYWMVTTLADRRRLDQERLADDLELLPIRELRAIGTRRGWALRGQRKHDIALQLAGYLSDPAHARQVLVALDNEEQRVLRAIVVLGTRAGFAHQEVEALARESGPLRRHHSLDPYVNRLIESGLLLSPEPVYVGGYSYAYVPDAIVRALSPALEGVIPDAAARAPHILAGEMRLADPMSFLRACGHVLLLLEETPTPLRPPMPRPSVSDTYQRLRDWDYVEEEVRAAQQRGLLARPDTLELTVPPPARALPDEAIARLAPAAGGEARLDLIYALLVTAGVLQAGSPVTVRQEVKARYMMRDLEGQRALLARAYFAATLWSETWELLRRNPQLRLVRHLDPWRTTLSPALLRGQFAALRALVMRVLTAVPDGQWVAIKDLMAVLRRVWKSFDVATFYPQVYPPSYLEWELRAQRGKDTSVKPEWDEAQGALVQVMLTEPLHWLGVTDLVYRQERLEAVRFNGLGDLYWDRVEAPALSPHARPDGELSPEQALRVDERRITVASSALGPEAHALLGRIARLERATLDGFSYLLDAATAYRAFESGEVLSDLLEGWDRLLPIPMPPSVRRTLEEWWQAYGRVRVYQDVAVIEFGDDYALAEVRAISSLNEVLVAEVSARAVIVPRQAVARLVAELERAGYTPKKTDET